MWEEYAVPYRSYFLTPEGSVEKGLSLVANQQNDLMRVLAVVATVFMPLGLIAGIYGMNFEYIPELGLRWGYFAVLGVMAAAIAAVLWIFWVRRWISVGSRRLVRFRPTTWTRY